jgi:hypothetical protein
MTTPFAPAGLIPAEHMTEAGAFRRPHPGVEKALRCECGKFLVLLPSGWACAVFGHSSLSTQNDMRSRLAEAATTHNKAKRKGRVKIDMSEEAWSRFMARICRWGTWRARYPEVLVEGEQQPLPFPKEASPRHRRRLHCRKCRESDKVVMHWDPDPPGMRLFVADYCARCRMTLAYASSADHRHRLPPNDF